MKVTRICKLQTIPPNQIMKINVFQSNFQFQSNEFMGLARILGDESLPGINKSLGMHVDSNLTFEHHTCRRREAPWSTSGTLVGHSLWTRPARVQSPWEARIIRCKNLALYIRDCESHGHTGGTCVTCRGLHILT